MHPLFDLVIYGWRKATSQRHRHGQCCCRQSCSTWLLTLSWVTKGCRWCHRLFRQLLLPGQSPALTYGGKNVAFLERLPMTWHPCDSTVCSPGTLDLFCTNVFMWIPCWSSHPGFWVACYWVGCVEQKGWRRLSITVLQCFLAKICPTSL